MYFRHICVATVILTMAAAHLSLHAQETAGNDSVLTENLRESVISAVRAPKNAPFAVSNINRRELDNFSNSGRELPMLFARTPGILAWSENGVGTGTAYMRIRGAGGSRINVTLDGVPLNSPEDQSVFWANMNSYGRLLESVQIQRGVGTSTNGDGAFGGTIALATRTPSETMESSISLAYGSHNTLHLGSRFSSGLLWKGFMMEAATYMTRTDGYLPGTNGLSGNYYGGVSWQQDRWKLSYKLIGNYEFTGQAWNGVVAGNDDCSLMDGIYGANTGINTYKDLYDAGLGLYNPLCQRLIVNSTEELDYQLERYRMNDGSYWPRTTDNFRQNHQLLNFAARLSDAVYLTITAHYTGGQGWYDEFRFNNKLTKYGLEPYFSENEGQIVKRADFVRRKGLIQRTFGTVANISCKKGRLDAVGGISVQQFLGRHYGLLTYTSATGLANQLGMTQLNEDTPYRYYDSDADKFDGSVFLKASYELSPQWSIFGDVQYRRVRYITGGYNDKYYTDDYGRPQKHFLDVDAHYDFFNPKAGINFSSGIHRAFASAAVSHREPERNNFTDNGKYPAPKAEMVYDFEAGYQVDGHKAAAGVNFYYMRYRDQLVQTGELSDIGEALTTNIRDSYRAGIELTARWSPLSWLAFETNAALSRNRLLDFDEFVEDWDNGTTVIHYENSTLAYSPSAIINAFVNIRHKNFRVQWHTGFVSRMYLDNTGNKDRSLPAYSLSDMSSGYTFRIPEGYGIKEIDLGVEANNLFSARVAQSGWVYSAIHASEGHPDGKRYYQIGFFPVAGLTVLGHLTLRF